MKSCHSNALTSLRFSLSFVFLAPGDFFRTRSRELVPPIAALLLAKCKTNSMRALSKDLLMTPVLLKEKRGPRIT